ncbi:MAG: alanine dehydrogenase [Candidatus Bathyarchaeota archaeon]|nr:alanine dehydrogenase [Candidatus Bathyarchaeota archaeon]
MPWEAIKLEILFLCGHDVKNLLKMEEAINAVEEAFREKGLGRVQMPPKQYLFYEKYGGDLRVMPSYLEKLDISAVKIVNSHPENMKYNLPTVMAVIVLVEPKTGAPLAIMDATWITAVRTGAASAVASKYLARKNSKILGLVGAGAQAYTQLKGISCTVNFKEVWVWSLKLDETKGFIKRVEKEYPEKVFYTAETVKDAVKNADIVVTATPSRKPLVDVEWIKHDAHINAIGADAPGKQELDPRILKKAKIVVDDLNQSCHGGEINVPLAKGFLKIEDIYGELGEVVAGKKAGRVSDGELTVFVSTGLAIQDAVTANLVYKKALKSGVGKFIDIKEFLSF